MKNILKLIPFVINWILFFALVVAVIIDSYIPGTGKVVLVVVGILGFLFEVFKVPEIMNNYLYLVANNVKLLPRCDNIKVLYTSCEKCTCTGTNYQFIIHSLIKTSLTKDEIKEHYSNIDFAEGYRKNAHIKIEVSDELDEITEKFVSVEIDTIINEEEFNNNRSDFKVVTVKVT